MLEVGIKGTKSIIVTEENTALTVGSGELAVFATPSMIALMEATRFGKHQSFSGRRYNKRRDASQCAAPFRNPGRNESMVREYAYRS